MRVRTRLGALVSSAVLAAILSVIVVGDGGPPRKLVNLPPADETPQLSGPGNYVHPPPPRFTYVGPQATADSYALAGLRSGGAYLFVFLFLHLLLRRFGNARRWSYATIGAVAGAVGPESVAHPQAWAAIVERGILSWYLASALLMGAIIGFGYYRAAGLEAEGDDPDLLERVLKQPLPAEGGEFQNASPAYVETEGAEYFDGPLQVRTVLPIALLAALLSAGLYAMIRMSFGALPEFANRLDHGVAVADAVALAFSSQLLTLVIMVFAAPIPFAAVVLLSHLILRAWGKTGYPAYLAIGLASPLLLGLLAGPMGVILGLQAIVPMALAMVIYRNMAGVEPARVKEDIILNDRRNLVGADHARRRFGRLIKG
jgi:hypothetical protein